MGANDLLTLKKAGFTKKTGAKTVFVQRF